MPKWFKYLIVVAIAVFAICVVVDAVRIKKSSNTTEIRIGKTEIGTKKARDRVEFGFTGEPVKKQDEVLGLFGAIFLYGIAGMVIIARLANHYADPKMKEYMKDCPYCGLGTFLFTLIGFSGLGTWCLMISLGFIRFI